MRKRQRSPLWLMALTILIDFTGFGLIIPLLPFWAEHLGASAFEVGLILTVYALAQFLFTPVLGSLSDRYGRKPIIVGSLLIETASLILSALAGSLPMLLLARFIGGIGASNIGSAQAVVSDVTTTQNRARGMGLMGAAIGLGFVVGPLLAGLLAPLGNAVPFWVAAAIALVNTFLVLFLLPETHAARTTTGALTATPGRRALIPGWRQAARNPAIFTLILVNLLFIMAFTGMETVFALFSQRTFHWEAAQNGYIFTYVGAIVVLMQGGLVGQLVKRWREAVVMIAGLIVLAVGLILLAFSTQLALLFVSLGLVSIGDGAVTPTISTLLSFSSAQERQGETLGLAQGMAGLGRGIAPVIAGALFAIAPGVPFVAGGILVLLTTLFACPVLSSIRRPLQAATTDVLSVRETDEPVTHLKK